MQHRAMQLRSRKMAAYQALEGEYSEDGLAAMAGEDNLQMALAKSLADRIDASDMQRSWTKVTSGPMKTKAARPAPMPMDGLPAELQLVVEALVRGTVSNAEPALFPGVLERIAAVDVAFVAMTADASSRIAEAEPERIKLKLVANPPLATAEPNVVEHVTLKLVQPVAQPEMGATFEVPEFTEELLLKMFANLAANGMTLEDLAG
jgi:hypothetical protein